MAVVRKLLFLGLGLVALQGVQACVTETELNPQPLPPEEEGANRGPENGSAKDDGTQATGGGSSGSSGATPASDAGTDAKDASDGGDG